MKLRRTLAAVTAAVIGTGSLAACSSGSQDTLADDATTIRIGTTDGSKKAWAVFEDKAKEAGITLDIKDFSDYSTPNLALTQNQIDVNLFQHLKFLAEYNVKNNQSLVPIGATEIVPLALYWKDHSDLNGIEGKTVAIPNDTTNQGRALHMLDDAGLVTIKEEAKDLVDITPADIDEKASKISLALVDPAQTTAAYGEGTPAVINNSFLDRAGIDPTSYIFADDPKSPAAEPYINVFVTKPENKNNKTLAKLAQLWHTEEVQKAVAEDSRGTSVPSQLPPAQLEEILKKIEEQKKNS
ncbi:methionine ABC transporter substrate-binding protein [Corynebacterium sp. sy017]|uniref:MetQ/NlpA family ABC transporter substrate-binding protein n=1 Tax=unclassified Corynebacterium TaxID=2624378 RepID=UPI001184B87B|nr:MULTISPECIES: MetQ/NlpA family ABC transporter substrate-binding protein [unclassified Corynebacterium]MBP3088679.1 methionine ABC transporter substrate-binding protein [Corynebacterium sp. sy017]QDZ42081.1 methionine ABC transporter substrate-binding protein [Corynebacterium sp. sy039]TSD91968.1 methionine ABC transporter substrate-binding protein [Corynebacterium sp. SY003]